MCVRSRWRSGAWGVSRRGPAHTGLRCATGSVSGGWGGEAPPAAMYIPGTAATWLRIDSVADADAEPARGEALSNAAAHRAHLLPGQPARADDLRFRLSHEKVRDPAVLVRQAGEDLIHVNAEVA